MTLPNTSTTPHLIKSLKLIFRKKSCANEPLSAPSSRTMEPDETMKQATRMTFAQKGLL